MLYQLHKANCHKSNMWLRWKGYLRVLQSFEGNHQRKCPSKSDIFCKMRLAVLVYKPLQKQNPWSSHEWNPNSFCSQTMTIKKRSYRQSNSHSNSTQNTVFRSMLQIRFVSLFKITRILLTVTAPSFLMFFHNFNLQNYHSKRNFRFCSLSSLKTILYVMIAYILCLRHVYHYLLKVSLQYQHKIILVPSRLQM
jgi:hypothetical protein